LKKERQRQRDIFIDFILELRRAKEWACDCELSHQSEGTASSICIIAAYFPRLSFWPTLYSTKQDQQWSQQAKYGTIAA
jgi:hypothetical protein